MSLDDSGPRLTQRQPYLLDLAPGDYLWCACGRSQRQPFCDGSHAGTRFTPLPFSVAGKTRTVWLCGCRRSCDLPYCDGRHNRLPGARPQD